MTVKTPKTTSNLTLQAEAIELAGDICDEALRMSAMAKFGNEVTDHAVQGSIVSFDRLRPQHVLPQETSHRLPLLPLTRYTHSKNQQMLMLVGLLHVLPHFRRVCLALLLKCRKELDTKHVIQ